jgi:FtsZ-interacting cell division protein ZipA
MAISELQLSLIILGVLAVVGVFGYNKWQERKYRRGAERAFQGERADVLFEAGAAQSAGSRGGAEERIEPIVPAAPPATAGVAEPVEIEAEMPVPEPAAPMVHAALDHVIRFEAAEPVAAFQLWEATRELLGGVAKPVRWLGWNEQKQTWQILQGHSAMNARHWRVALQLADRRGAVTPAEIEAFLQGVQQLADRLLAVTDFPDRSQIASRAEELDRFGAGVDVQIGIHLVANDPAGFPGTKLRGIAEAAGLVLEEDGMFHARDDAGQDLYTMSNLEPALFVADAMNSLTTHGLTLSLDVPRVANGGAAFGGMVSAAQQLAVGLNGTLVDDNRAPLAQKSLEMIRAKIVEFQDQMSQRGVAAGSAAALRLFSA